MNSNGGYFIGLLAFIFVINLWLLIIHKEKFFTVRALPKTRKMHEGMKIGFPPHLLSFLRSLSLPFKVSQKYISKQAIYSNLMFKSKKLALHIEISIELHI